MNLEQMQQKYNKLKIKIEQFYINSFIRYHFSQITVLSLLHCNIQGTSSYSLVCKGMNIITTTYKSLNHATLNHAVCCATLQNIELTIRQETIQIAQIKFYKKCTYNTDKCWPHFTDFLQGQKVIMLGPVAPGLQLKNFWKRA